MWGTKTSSRLMTGVRHQSTAARRETFSSNVSLLRRVWTLWDSMVNNGLRCSVWNEEGRQTYTLYLPPAAVMSITGPAHLRRQRRILSEDDEVLESRNMKATPRTGQICIGSFCGNSANAARSSVGRSHHWTVLGERRSSRSPHGESCFSTN